MKRLILSLIFICLILCGSKLNAQPTASHKDSTQKAVLITGATSGIGLNMAKTLAQKGYYIYAGARKDKDMQRLSAMKNITAVKLDVTKDEQIAAAVKFVEKQGRGLFALVNNAGILSVAPLTEMSDVEFDRQMKVNVYGPYKVTKAFAPLIKESKGRIISTGSVAGIFSSAMLGSYAMTKHAIEAFTDSLGAEMKKFGVSVSVIEPGNFNTKVTANMLKRLQQQDIDLTQDTDYVQEVKRTLEFFKADRNQYKSPDLVSAALLEALTAEAPLRRYMVVPEKSEALFTLTRATQRLNELYQSSNVKLSAQEMQSRFNKHMSVSDE